MGSSSGVGNVSSSAAQSDGNTGGMQPTSGNTAAFNLPTVETPSHYQAASYGPNHIHNQLASGYQQVFGREADTGGLNYWANRLGGQNMSQDQVNRYLLGGATGTDVAGGSDYALSLTGGRPQPGKAFYQPIYNPTYTNYAMNRGFYSPGYGPFGGGGGFYNPFAYSAPMGGYGGFRGGLGGLGSGLGGGGMPPASIGISPGPAESMPFNPGMGGTSGGGGGGGINAALPQTRNSMIEYAEGGDVDEPYGGIDALGIK